MHLRIIVVFVVLAALAPAASAQDFQPTETQAKCIDRLAALNASSEQMKEGEEKKDLGPIGRIVALGDDCIAALRDDPKFTAYLDKQLLYVLHAEEAEEWTEDQRHVVMAYIAIWVLTAGFLAMLFVRQGKLRGEIERLQGEVTRAAREAQKK